MPKISVFSFGGGGVNIVKGPLQSGDTESTQLQNAELIPDQSLGGQGVLSKRGGLSVLNGSALAGTILGMIGLNLKTTYTRTLYVARQSATSDVFHTTTNGTSFSLTALPLKPAIETKFTDANGERDARRHATYKNFIIYPYDTYTKGTDNPVLAIWDGTNALQTIAIPVGPSATAATPAFVINDILVANGKIWLAIHDPGGSAPSLAGRVMSFDLATGLLAQVAAPFGNGTGETTGGYPSCLAFYQNQIWAGLQGNTTTDGIGKVVRCFPDIASTWTSDTTTLSGFPSSMTSYKGDLFVGTQSSTSSVAKVYRRSATAGTYAASYTATTQAANNAFLGNLIVYNDELYASEYYDGSDSTPILVHIKKYDNSTWTTDRDVDANDGTGVPGASVILGSDLYFSFRSTTTTATDGFLMRRASGAWTKVLTANLAGPLSVLVQKT